MEVQIDVLLKKEEITNEKIDGKTVVVFDILLATSTITKLLEVGATHIYPLVSKEEVNLFQNKYEYIIAGEHQGKSIEGFKLPLSTIIAHQVRGKKVVLLTTNGTKAIRKSEDDGAKEIFIGSLMNNEALVKYIQFTDIVLICAASEGEFALEDAIGAGHFIYEMNKRKCTNMSDPALATFMLYEQSKEQLYDIISQTKVGRWLDYHYPEEVAQLISLNRSFIVPAYKKGIISIKEMEEKG